MDWKRLGMVFCPDGHADWMVSHAANPVAEHRGGDLFRVYFGCRDRKNRSHVGWVEVELSPESAKVVRVAEEPALAPGVRGAFDDSGTSVGCLVPDGERMLLYYVGWNLGVTVPWRNSIGLAVREGREGPFVRHSIAPVLDRSSVDPFNLSYPCVLREGTAWRMWYGSNRGWNDDDADVDHVIRHARSEDGVRWVPDGTDRLAPMPGECALCRPWVVSRAGGYRMWFCHRGKEYKLGYAESPDGLDWRRDDARAGLETHATGWDGEMVAYPSLVAHRDRLFLFYSGNQYGKTGFGVATTLRPFVNATGAP